MNNRQWHLSDQWLQRDAFEVMCAIDDHNGRSLITFELTQHAPLEPTVLTEYTPSGLWLSPDDAQQLMNELWRVGVRPRDGSGSIAQVEAMRAHLADMRRLVFEQEPPP